MGELGPSGPGIGPENEETPRGADWVREWAAKKLEKTGQGRVIEGSQARREETSEVLLDPQLNAAIDEQNEAMLQRDVAHQKAKSIAAEQSEREPGRKAAVAAGERRRQTRRETNSDFPPEVVDATSDEGLRRLREARADRAKQDLLDAAFTSHRSPGDRFGPGEISPEDGARIRQDQDKAGEESQGG